VKSSRSWDGSDGMIRTLDSTRDVTTFPCWLIRGACRVRLILALLVMCMGATACREQEIGQAPATLVAVRAGQVEEITVPREIVVPAEIEPESKVLLAPEVSGMIKEIRVREGDRITRGEPLILIDDRDHRNSLAQAEAGLAAAQAQVASAEQTYNVVRTQFERMEKLWESKSISEAAYDKVRARHEQARSGHLSAQAQLKAARAQLATVQSMVEDCVITAPFDGYVAARLENPGAVVQTMPPTSLMLVVQLDPVRIKASVPEQILTGISLGMPAEVLLDALPGDVSVGEIAAISPLVDPASRNGTVEVRLANPEGKIRPGMAARVRITLGERAYLSVPRSCLLSGVSDREGQVFALDSSNRAQRRQLKLAGFYEEKALVTDGLLAGERVVIRGMHAVADGAEVRVEE